MFSTREPSDDGSAKTKGAPKPSAGAPPPDRGDQDPSQAVAVETDGAEDLTIAADERIQTTGGVAGMSETIE
jgi:hypothetical protein